MNLSGKSVSLVLGSGGARGLAHIGAIRELEKADVRIEAIAGSSMGALVGGIYAAGKLDAYEEWVCALEQSDMLSLVDWTISGGGLIRGRKIINKLSELVGETSIEDLSRDFTAVAVDIDHGREVWLDRGSLFEAIRASIAIPGLFTPHRYRNRTLVDGGLLNPIPVAATLRSMTDLTIVVDVNGPVDSSIGGDDDLDQAAGAGVVGKFREFIDRFSSDEKSEEPTLGLITVMLRSLETMEAAITRHHLAIFEPDLVIRVPKNICMAHEFHRARDVIDLGAALTRKKIGQNDPDSSSSKE